MLKKYIKKFNALFFGENDKFHTQFIRYIPVGGIAFIFDFGLLFILTNFFNIYYLISASFAFIVGLIINYFLSINWVFNKRCINKKEKEFAIFAIIGVVGLILTNIILWVFTDLMGFYYLISKIFATIMVLLWNFTVRKLLLFK